MVYFNYIKQVQDDSDSYPTFTVDKGILYKHVYPHFEIVSTLSSWKIVVLSPNRSDIFKMYHYDPTGGHFGVLDTLSRISELYYLPGMRKSVYLYVRKCSICASCKSSSLLFR